MNIFKLGVAAFILLLGVVRVFFAYLRLFLWSLADWFLVWWSKSSERV